MPTILFVEFELFFAAIKKELHSYFKNFYKVFLLTVLSVFNISTWSLVISLTGILSRKNASLLAKLKGKFIKYLFNFNSFNKKINISLKLRMSGPPTSIIWPSLNFLFMQPIIIWTKSDTSIGWK